MFKIGDRVRSISTGQKGTITNSVWGYSNFWDVTYDGYSYSQQINENQLTLVDESNKQQGNKMEKFYRVKKDTYLFTVGAILSNKDNNTQYKATDDIWHVEGNETLKKFLDGQPAVASDLVENSPDWFERVYKVSSIRGMAYVVKSAMKDLMSKVAVNKDGEVEVGADVETK